MKNVVLIGMRGSGKSTVAALVAAQLSVPVIEVDDEIVRVAGVSIREMVIVHGWDYFRDKESETIKAVSEKQGVVISTGGGAVVRPDNIEALKKNGMFVYLRSSVETLRSRMGNDPERPALTNAGVAIDEIEDVYLRRSPIYESAADVTIDTDGKSSVEVCTAIIDTL